MSELASLLSSANEAAEQLSVIKQSNLASMFSNIATTDTEKARSSFLTNVEAPGNGPSMESVASMFEAMGQKSTQKGLEGMSDTVAAVSKSALPAQALSFAMDVMSRLFAPFQSVTGTFNSLISMLSTGFQPIVNDINMALLELMPYMQQGAAWIRETYAGLKEWVTGLTWDEFKQWMVDLPSLAVQWLSERADDLKNWFKNLPDDFLVKIVQNAGPVLSWFAQLPANIVSWIWDNREPLWNWFVSLPSTIVSWIGANIASLGEYIGGWPGTIVTWLGTTISDLWTWFAGLPTKIKDELENNISIVIDWFKALPKKIYDALASAVEGAGTEVSNWWNGLWD